MQANTTSLQKLKALANPVNGNGVFVFFRHGADVYLTDRARMLVKNDSNVSFLISDSGFKPKAGVVYAFKVKSSRLHILNEFAMKNPKVPVHVGGFFASPNKLRSAAPFVVIDCVKNAKIPLSKADVSALIKNGIIETSNYQISNLERFKYKQVLLSPVQYLFALTAMVERITLPDFILNAFFKSGTEAKKADVPPRLQNEISRLKVPVLGLESRGSVYCVNANYFDYLSSIGFDGIALTNGADFVFSKGGAPFAALERAWFSYASGATIMLDYNHVPLLSRLAD
ncbi:MAG: hypothetical protein NTX79_00325 [Candidatus Micrarchaeota archaeon]|nr:hypothetical protein [Candidatus Micrarchaeota archaeon]